MSETIMKLNNDGRIVQIDNVSWSYYIDVDRARSLEDHKSGKWMHFFNDISFAAAICRKAVLEGTVAECKHTSASATNDGCGVICFYLNADDLEAHRRTLTFMLKNDLIRRTKAGKLYNIDLTLREISEATVEKQEEALRKKRSLSSRCPSYKNSAPAGRQIKQTEDTGFETPTKPHGILGRLKGLFDKFRK